MESHPAHAAAVKGVSALKNWSDPRCGPVPPYPHPVAQGAYMSSVDTAEQLSETAIPVEGREDDQSAFADRLEQLHRLCR